LKGDEKITFNAIKKKCSRKAKECCRMEKVYRSFLSLFPVLTWLPAYQWKTDLCSDILAGLTVGIMSIPQGKHGN
jgi:hypothetical protein